MLDKAIDKLFDAIVESQAIKCEEIFEETKLKQVLKKTICDYVEMQGISNPQFSADCIIDKESMQNSMQNIDKSMIAPNLTIEELEKNLSRFLDNCIITDNKELARRIKRYICHSYKIAVASFVSLSQIDDDVHSVNKTVKDSTDKIYGKVDEAERRIVKTLQKMPQQQLVFIDELDNSRVYCYITLKLTEDLDEEFLDILAEDLCAETDIFIDEHKFWNVSFNFLEPVTQGQLKEFLVYLDKQFSKYDIGILSITSHF